MMPDSHFATHSVDPTGTVRSGFFVGRQREMGELEAALKEALAGQGQLVMLVGESGIGKTRTARELVTSAEKAGAQVLWGWCYEGEGAPPYWPWVQPLRSYVLQKDPESLREEMGIGAATIAEIIPEVHTRLPDLKPPPALDSPEQARFRLFDSITTFLKNASQARPLMLVLDDLHWADQPSLLLLQFLARQLTGSRLLVAGCYRDVELSRQHPLSETLAQLSREPVLQRVMLRGLNREDAGPFIEATASVRPSLGLVDTVYAHTEGNPYFMTEVIRSLREQGELDTDRAIGLHNIRIPGGVREVIGQRLNRLSHQCHEALTTASIIGREFSFKLLSMLIGGFSDEQLLTVIDEALGAHLIEELPGGADRYQFSHALVQQTLAEELSRSRRVRLHARIGEALEELYGADAAEHAAELAYHFAQAEPVLGPEKVVKYSLLAGELALAVYAHGEALEHFQNGLAAKGGYPMDGETADLLFGLGRAQVGTVQSQDMGEAVANLRRAFDYYYKIKDAPRAIAVAEFPVQGGSINLGRAEIAGQALSLVTPSSQQEGRLLFTYGFFLYQERGDYEGSREALGQALDIAQREGDKALELRTLVGLGHVEAYHLQFQESLEYDLRALELARHVDDLFQKTHAQLEVASALHHTGDLEGARNYATALLRGAERLHNRMRLSQSLCCNMAIEILEGDWQAARALSERGLAVMPGGPSALGYRAIMEYTLGELEEGQAHLERLVDITRSNPANATTIYTYTALVLPLIARITGVDVYPEVAEAAAQAVLSTPGVEPVRISMVRAGLALQAVNRQDAAGARDQYVALERRRGTMLGGTFESAIAAYRLLGLLAQTLGNFGQAAAHFEDGLAFCRRAGYRPELAWTCYDYAETLILSGQCHEAVALLEEARSVSEDLGMRLLLERLAALEAQAKQGPAPLTKYPAGLTEREVEVLRLIAEGKTNREMADELVLSQRTVQRHIANVYAKINARNRAEATTFLLTNLNKPL